MTDKLTDVLGGLDWLPVEAIPNPDRMPVVTHQSSLTIGVHILRCYRLDDGRTIINADDFTAFFGQIEL